MLAFLGTVGNMKPSTGTLQDEEGPDLGFTYRVRKSGDIEIRRRGRLAAILCGTAAADFLAEAESGFAAGQQAMARLTGNYKHGNERVARQHPRNRR